MANQAFLIEKSRLVPWIDALGREYRLVGPVVEDGIPSFKPTVSAFDLMLDYGLTMMGPQVWIYQLTEKICTLRRLQGAFHAELPERPPAQLVAGVHACDLHGLLVLDKVFLKGRIVDRNYRMWRENTVVLGYHCTRVYPNCFCASMGTGPFFEPQEGCDFLVTDLGEDCLIETIGPRALSLLSPLHPASAGEQHFARKEQLRRELLSQFEKKIDTSHLVESLLGNPDHPIWKRTAEERCLGCTNCTMVCPTCFCYNVKDLSPLDPDTWDRIRYKDSCQEYHFAQFHGGNFRSTRTARLRQFVMHKLATWQEQFGCFGCVGCGRCMHWCPTCIDLTDMAEAIMASA